MKLTLFLILLSFTCFSQEIRPVLTLKQQTKEIYTKGYNTSKFNGYKVKTKIGIFRARTFGNDIQLTWIIGNYVQIRLYAYIDVFDKRISKAVSLRVFF